MHTAALVVAAIVALAGALVALRAAARPRARRGRPSAERRPSGSSCPHERDRRAHARAAPLRGGRPGDRARGARAARRGRLPRADDGEGARALRRRQGDALPPLRLQGGARARGVEHLHHGPAGARRHRQPAGRLRGGRASASLASARPTGAPHADAAAAGRGRRRRRSCRRSSTSTLVRAAAARSMRDRSRAGDRARRDPRGRRPRAGDRRDRRPDDLQDHHHRRRPRAARGDAARRCSSSRCDGLRPR